MPLSSKQQNTFKNELVQRIEGTFSELYKNNLADVVNSDVGMFVPHNIYLRFNKLIRSRDNWNSYSQGSNLEDLAKIGDLPKIFNDLRANSMSMDKTFKQRQDTIYYYKNDPSTKEYTKQKFHGYYELFEAALFDFLLREQMILLMDSWKAIQNESKKAPMFQELREYLAKYDSLYTETLVKFNTLEKAPYSWTQSQSSLDQQYVDNRDETEDSSALGPDSRISGRGLWRRTPTAGASQGSSAYLGGTPLPREAQSLLDVYNEPVYFDKNKKYTIKAYNNKFCSTSSITNYIMCDKLKAGKEESFTIKELMDYPNNNKFSITRSGEFSKDRSGQPENNCQDRGEDGIRCNIPHVRGWEQFTITKAPGLIGDKFLIRGGNNSVNKDKYCTVDGKNALVCNTYGDAINDLGIFEITEYVNGFTTRTWNKMKFTK